MGWRFLLAIAALLIVCAAVVSLVSNDDWARITSFILSLIGLLSGVRGLVLQRNLNW